MKNYSETRKPTLITGKHTLTKGGCRATHKTLRRSLRYEKWCDTKKRFSSRACGGGWALLWCCAVSRHRAKPLPQRCLTKQFVWTGYMAALLGIIHHHHHTCSRSTTICVFLYTCSFWFVSMGFMVETLYDDRQRCRLLIKFTNSYLPLKWTI